MQTILSIVVFSFGLTTILPIIVDRATGGHVKTFEGPAIYGNYSPDALFPIFFLSGRFPFDVTNSGIFHGMVELVRRVIRRDLVSGHVQKLETLDSIVKPLSLHLIKGSRLQRICSNIGCACIRRTDTAAWK
jgi:hypothetical protein